MPSKTSVYVAKLYVVITGLVAIAWAFFALVTGQAMQSLAATAYAYLMNQFGEEE